jgi:hypothetical protein
MIKFIENLRFSEILAFWILLAWIAGITIDGVHYRLGCVGCHYEIQTEETAR